MRVMCFVGIEPFGLDVDTVTGNLYFTNRKLLKRLTKNANTPNIILDAPATIFGIAVDPLNR